MSAKPIALRRLAEKDVEEAVAHYVDEGGDALALRFIDSLETAFLRVGNQPAMGSPRYATELGLPGLRYWPLKRFPYLVFYVEHEDHVDVWRVLTNSGIFRGGFRRAQQTPRPDEPAKLK